MRGSGYAIGEIVIFLAIASIIGFLIGWVVFYRRPGKADGDLSPVNPNHVRQLETRTRAIESKMARLEQRATALLGRLSKAAGATPAEAPAGAAAPAAGAQEEAGRAESAPESAAAEAAKIAPAAAAPAGAGKERSGDHPPAQPEKPAEPEEPAEGAAAQKAEAAPAPKGAAAPAGEPKPEAGKPAGDGLDEYLSEADDRIARLEQTLDKLNEKLAELDED